MKKFILEHLLVVVLLVFFGLVGSNSVSYASPNEKETVTFYVHLHCQECVKKVMDNIAFEKGVKDIQCDIDNKTVSVTFLSNKTDIPTLQQAFKKINKPAFMSLEEYKLYYKE